MAQALRKEERKPYTFADYLQWDNGERYELIDGAAYMMAPPSPFHQGIRLSLSAQLYAYLKGKPCRAFTAPFGVRLFEKAGDTPKDVKTVVQPDIAVICDRSRLDARGCRGAPDFVIEIVSPSNPGNDRLRKYQLYQRAGVREYWMVDRRTRTVLVCVLGADGRYSLPEVYRAEDKIPVSVLKGCVLDMAEAFAEGETGNWPGT